MPVSRLTLKQLHAVAAVYRTGRVSAAAERLRISQSAVSVLIRQAEETLGLRLFDRTTRSLEPTVATEQAIGVIERILGDIDALSDTMSELRTLDRGQVRLTATPATGQAFLPGTVRRFRKAHPAISLVLDDCAPSQFLSKIRQERAEFGVGLPPPDRSEFDWIPLHDDPLCLVCPRDHPLAGLEQIRWDELSGVPLVLSRRDYGVRDQVERALSRQGVRPRIVSEVGFLGSALWLAEAGVGLCVMPAGLSRGFLGDGLCAVALVEPSVTRTVAVVTRRGISLSPPCRGFVDMLIEDQSQPPEPATLRARHAG